MEPVQTLHEFATKLLSDPTALADFNAAPQAMLAEAGLGDVSAADVQDILPMVMDTAPALSDAANTADVTGTLDRAADTTGVAGVGDTLSDLPNLSGVFGAVSGFAQQTGLNEVTDGALNAVSGTVDGIADATHDVPVVGPLVDAAAIDLQHTVAGVGEHLYDGKLVGAALDGVTAHLTDTELGQTLVDTVSGVPGIGEPVGGLVDEIRETGDDVLDNVNGAIGTTPIGGALTGAQETVDTARADLTDAADHVGDVTEAAQPTTTAEEDGLLSPVFGAVSGVAEQTGLNDVTDATLNGASGIVDSVAGVTHDVPVVGPLVDAGAVDLQNTVAGVGEHLYDGKLVGAAVDGVTAHLGDAALGQALVDTVSGVPGLGEPLGGLVDDVRHGGDDVLDSVNETIGSTPIGEGALDASAPAAPGAAAPMDAVDAAPQEKADFGTDPAAQLNDVADVAKDATAPVHEAAAPVQDAVEGPADTVTDAASQVGETAQQVAAEPTQALAPAHDAVQHAADTAADATQDVPVAGQATEQVADHVDDLNIGHVAGELDLPGAEDLPQVDDLHF